MGIHEGRMVVKLALNWLVLYAAKEYIADGLVEVSNGIKDFSIWRLRSCNSDELPGAVLEAGETPGVMALGGGADV